MPLAYASISDLLTAAGAPVSLAELHGGLCGVFCAGGRASGQHWLEHQFDDCAAAPDDVAALAEGLADLATESWRALAGASFEFEPLLPDDGGAIDARVEALAAWCHGFLSGLVAGGYRIEGEAAPSPELEEIVHDFVAISQAGVDDDEVSSPETTEAFFVELSEYVRVSVQIVFESLGAWETADEPQTLH